MVFCLSGSAAETRTGTSAWCSPYLVLSSFAILPHFLVLWNGPIGRQSLSFPLGRWGERDSAAIAYCAQYSVWTHIRCPSAERRELFSLTKTCPSYVLCLWGIRNFCFELLLPLSRAFAVLQCRNLLLTFNQSLCPFLPVLLAFNLCTIFLLSWGAVLFPVESLLMYTWWWSLFHSMQLISTVSQRGRGQCSNSAMLC